MSEYISCFFEKENVLDTVICYLEPKEIIDSNIGKYSLLYRIDEVKDFKKCLPEVCKYSRKKLINLILKKELIISIGLLKTYILEYLKTLLF